MIKSRIKEAALQNPLLKVARGEIPVSEWLRAKILGLGLINFSLFAILNFTGILLMFYYVPHPERAYQSIKDLQFAISFGRIIRNMHRWSAFTMIVSVFLHMSRVYYMAEYRKPRQFNWVIGMCLFLLTLGAGLTGYTLLWDQKAYWGVTILSNVMGAAPILGEKIRYLVLGGTVVGANTLNRVFAVHVKVLPLLMGFMMALHFRRIRSNDLIPATDHDSSAPSERIVLSNDPAQRSTWPDIIRRELSKSLFILALVMAASILFDAPLEEIATPSITPNPTKAVWFFLGLQEMLSWGAPFWWAIVVPSTGIVLLFLVPYIDRGRLGTGVWFHPSRRLQNILFTAFVTVVLGLMVVGYFLRGPGWHLYWPWEPWPVH